MLKTSSDGSTARFVPLIRVVIWLLTRYSCSNSYHGSSALFVLCMHVFNKSPNAIPSAKTVVLQDML